MLINNKDQLLDKYHNHKDQDGPKLAKTNHKSKIVMSKVKTNKAKV
jgi:hypothetical protein